MGKIRYDKVLCSKGYPGNYEKNKHIDLKNINENKKLFIYHAGTKRILNKIYSNGGRVLNIVAKGNSFKEIRRKITTINKINWHGFFRKDIGWRVINK